MRRSGHCPLMSMGLPSMRCSTVIVALVAELWEYIKTPHFIQVTCRICELHLNKPMLLKGRGDRRNKPEEVPAATTTTTTAPPPWHHITRGRGVCPGCRGVELWESEGTRGNTRQGNQGFEALQPGTAKMQRLWMGDLARVRRAQQEV